MSRLMKDVPIMVAIVSYLLIILAVPSYAQTSSFTNFYSTHDAAYFVGSPYLSGNDNSKADRIVTMVQNDTVFNPAGNLVFTSGKDANGTLNHTSLYIKADWDAVTTDIVTLSDQTTHNITMITHGTYLLGSIKDGVWNTLIIDGKTKISWESNNFGGFDAFYIDLFGPKNQGSTPYVLLACTQDPQQTSMGNAVAVNISSGAYITQHSITSNVNDNAYNFYQCNNNREYWGLSNTLNG